MPLYYVFLAVATILLALADIDVNTCRYDKQADVPEAYFINLPGRTDRRDTMSKLLMQMHIPYERVRGITPSDFLVPPDINSSSLWGWNGHDFPSCKYETSWKPPKLTTIPKTGTGLPPIYVASLCSGLEFSATELACVISHLAAIRQACYSKTAKSRFALILEDDVFFPLDVNWKALISSAPSGFGVLHLLSSPWPYNHLWADYKRNNTQLWSARHTKSGAVYLIDREVMRPIIDKIIQVTQEGWLQFRIIAGGIDESSCHPIECCEPGTSYFTNKLPCVQVNHLVADVYIYRLAKTYTLTAPISCLGDTTFKSDLRPDGVPYNDAQYSRLHLNEMISGKVPLPPFAKPACHGMLRTFDPKIVPMLPSDY